MDYIPGQLRKDFLKTLKKELEYYKWLQHYKYQNIKVEDNSSNTKF